MRETYFVIINSEGETTVTEKNKEQLLKEIEDGEHKDILSAIPDSETSYWGGGTLIIKGTIIVPKAEQVVTKYSIE